MNFWQRWGTRFPRARPARLWTSDATVAARTVTPDGIATITGASHLHDSEYIGENWCPGCYPERDPLTEILHTHWCSGHEPSLHGSEDAHVETAGYLSGSGEAGGENNAAWCARIHRGLTVSMVSSSGVGEGAPFGTEYDGCG